MKKEKIIDFNLQKARHLSTQSQKDSISDELQKAIQHLIYRLRELGPIQPS